ncbi:hypothetical protein [Paenibacillus sp. JCM 10914]
MPMISFMLAQLNCGGHRIPYLPYFVPNLNIGGHRIPYLPYFVPNLNIGGHRVPYLSEMIHYNAPNASITDLVSGNCQKMLELLKITDLRSGQQH